MSKHTPEPWFIGTGAQQNAAMIRRDAKRGQAICQVFYTSSVPSALGGNGSANAARIVACVNALANIPDPAAFVKAARELAVTAEAYHIRHPVPIEECPLCSALSAFVAADARPGVTRKDDKPAG